MLQLSRVREESASSAFIPQMTTPKRSDAHDLRTCIAGTPKAVMKSAWLEEHTVPGSVTACLGDAALLVLGLRNMILSTSFSSKDFHTAALFTSLT